MIYFFSDTSTSSKKFLYQTYVFRRLPMFHQRFLLPTPSRQGISGKCVARRIHVYALMHIDSNSVHPAKAPPAAKFAMADELGDEEEFGGMQISSK